MAPTSGCRCRSRTVPPRFYGSPHRSPTGVSGATCRKGAEGGCGRGREEKSSSRDFEAQNTGECPPLRQHVTVLPQFTRRVTDEGAGCHWWERPLRPSVGSPPARTVPGRGVLIPDNR
jgi:hypothetical protein